MSNTFLRWAWLSLLLASTPARAQGPAAASPTKEAPVTLHQALKLAEKSAPTIHVARAEAKAGRAEVDAASPLLPSDPVLFGSVGRRTTAAGSGIDYSIGLEQEIDVAGKRSKRLDAARSDLAARRAELSASKWSVHQRVHAAYHRAIVARERLAAAGRVLRFSERVVDVARQRLSAGETSPLPVRLAETQLAEARQERMRSQSAYNRVRLELGRWVGWTGAGLLTPTGRLHAPRVPPPAETLLRRARHEQPALVAARARSAAAHAGLRSAERSAWPNPTLGVVVESEAEPGAEAAHIVRGTLSLPLPLWVRADPGTAAPSALAARRQTRRRHGRS